MRVLHIINSLHTGGAEKLIIDTLPMLEKSGLQVGLALLNDDETSFYKELKKRSNVKIYGLSKGSVYNPLNIFKIMPMLKHYDLVHAHLFPVQYYLVLAKILSRSRTRLVFTEHSTNNRRLNNPKFHFVDKFINKFYKRIICVSTDVKNKILEKLQLPIDKVIVIENGVDVKSISESRAQTRSSFGFTDHHKLICMVAGFKDPKDQDTIIRTLKFLPDHYRLLLVGDGARREELEQLVKDEGVVEKVAFLGFRNDVSQITKMCDIAILSSRYEGLPLSIVEAMAAGIPTIGSRVQGLSDVMKNGGLLFNQGDVQDLKEKLLSLENEAFYSEISERGRLKAEQYDISQMIQKLIKVYQEVCSS